MSFLDAKMEELMLKVHMAYMEPNMCQKLAFDYGTNGVWEGGTWI
jgi:hypothetical protein